MLQVPLDVEGDHSGASGALSLHELVLGVRGQGCTGKENRAVSKWKTGWFYCLEAAQGPILHLWVSAV